MMHNRLREIAETSGQRASNQREVVGRLIREMSAFRGSILLATVFVILGGVTQGLSPYLIGRAVDQFIFTRDASGLASTMLILAGVYVVSMFATRFQIYYIARTGQFILASMRQRVFEKIESLQLQFLESKQAGDLMSRLVNDIDALNSFFSQALPQFVGSLFALIGIVVAMLLLSWQLAIVVLLMVPVLLLTTRYFSGRARRAFRQTRETLGDVSANLEEELGGVKVAQAFNRTGENVRRFSARNAANRDANVSATAVTSAFSPAMDLLSTIDLALVAGIGGAMAIAGTVSVGTVVAFIQYVQNFFRPIQTVAQLWTTTQSAFAAAERVFDLMDMQATIQDEPGAIQLTDLRGQVRFEDVSFRYEDDQPVLENVSFEAPAGQTVALVGPTGAGKTTMISLIMRFYDVTGGCVEIDGYDIRRIQQRNLRSFMGLVTQEPFLFSGSILENIRYGRVAATDEEVFSAARAANADEFITRLPEGYQTDVGERGSLLSQGQRQLISIARAVLADPRILILDEATASIDTRTELLIQKALDQLMEGRTSFVIAHRLSTVRNADQVLVLDQSQIVERGTHKQLMDAGGLYADLYRRQFFEPSQRVQPEPSPSS